MAQKAFTMLFYIVPEDLDDIEQPNAFGIHKNQEDIKTVDIADSFPLPGEYIFRYRYKFQNSIVWMDINQNSNKIPLFNGKIYIKATRVSWTKSGNNNSSQKTTQASQNNVQTASAQVPRQPSNQGQAQQQQQSFAQNQQKAPVQQQVRTPVNQSGYSQMEQPVASNGSGSNKYAAAQTQGTNGSSQTKSTNLLDDYEPQAAKQTQKQNKTNLLEADLLDMDDLGNGSGSNQKQGTKSNNDDLWDF